ncbi:META domain-containing protein [Cerasicoccus maritimus]|uniref:META domain-containing protein n=1 Tax=Cerasicoccus maritimus TaxID=490089 RepID=UPI0028526B5A|nr:META domain-containing protein [Cerasicoccus maritimus]
MSKHSVSIILLTLTFGLVAFFSGCASSKSMPTENDQTYSLTSIDGEAPTVEAVTLELKNKEIHGNGPINRWQASVEFGKVGPMIVTRRGGPAHIMQFESRFISQMEGSVMEQKTDELVFSKTESTIVFSKSE